MDGIDGIGITSVCKLEESGVTSFAELSKRNVDGFVAIGICKDIAKRIVAFVSKRPR